MLQAIRRAPLGARILLGAAALSAVGALGAGAWGAWRMLRPGSVKAPAATPPAAAFKPAKSRDAWNLAAYCPEASVAFVSVRDLPAVSERVKKSDLDRILSSPAFAQVAGAVEILARSAGRTAWLSDPVRRAAFLGTLKDACSGEAAFVLTEIEKPDSYRPVPHVLLVVRPADDRAGLLEPLAERFFSALLASSRGLERRESTHAGARIRMVGDADVSFAWAVQDGVLMAASHEATLRGALDLGAGRGASLLSSPVFKEVCRDVGCRDLIAYVNLDRVWKSMPPSKRPPEASGFADVDALAAGLEVAPPICCERLALHTSKSRSGFLQTLENPPLQEIPPGLLPPRLLSYSRACVGLDRAWDAAMRAAQKVLNPAEARVVLGAVDAFNRQMGFRLREDLLQSLDDTVTTVTVAGSDPSKPESVTLWTLKDPGRFKGCIDTALGALDRLETRPLRRNWVGGSEVFVVDPEGWNAVMPWSWPRGVPPLAFGVVQGGLVASDRAELVSGWGRARADAEENAGLRKAWDERPAKSWAFSYADLSAWASSGAWASQVRDLAHQGVALPPGVAPLLGAAPGSFQAGAISPFTAAVFNTPRSVVMECKGPVPLVTAVLAAVAISANPEVPFALLRLASAPPSAAPAPQ